MLHTTQVRSDEWLFSLGLLFRREGKKDQPIVVVVAAAATVEEYTQLTPKLLSCPSLKNVESKQVEFLFFDPSMFVERTFIHIRSKLEEERDRGITTHEVDVH